MAKTVVEWFDEEIKWAEDESRKRETGCFDYYEGYKKAMETAKYKLLGQGII